MLLDKFPQTNLEIIILYKKTNFLTQTNLTDLEKNSSVIFIYCNKINNSSIVTTLILVRFTFASWEVPRLTEENNCHIFSLQIYIYSLSLDCDAKGVDVALAGEIILPPTSHLLTLLGKQVDVKLAGELFFPPNQHLLTFLGK
jgi:hypothetical protein